MRIFGVIVLIVLVIIVSMGAYFSQAIYQGVDNETHFNNTDVVEPQYEAQYAWMFVIGAILVIAVIIAALWLFFHVV